MVKLRYENKQDGNIAFWNKNSEKIPVIQLDHIGEGGGGGLMKLEIALLKNKQSKDKKMKKNIMK